MRVNIKPNKEAWEPCTMIFCASMSFIVSGCQNKLMNVLFFHFRTCHTIMFRRRLLDRRRRYWGTGPFVDQFYRVFHCRCSQSPRWLLRHKQLKFRQALYHCLLHQNIRNGGLQHILCFYRCFTLHFVCFSVISSKVLHNLIIEWFRL